MSYEDFTGVIGIDPRIDSNIINGWNIDEILPQAAVLDWKEKSEQDLVKYPVWNQHKTSACVAFSKAKQLSIRVFKMTGVWIDFSPASIYQLRQNKPGEGMYVPNANDIVNKTGATLEALMKSQNLTEDQINTVKRTKVASMFANAIAAAVVKYLYITDITIDRIAQTIESGKAVSLLIFAENDEYARLVPKILNQNLTYASAPIHHEIVAIDYYLDHGEKKIRINDSAHFAGLAVRDFTKGFLEKRCVMADALDVFTFEPEEGDKPSYDNATIISAQKCLRYEGLFPVDVPFAEVIGPVTKEAINKFQVKYGLHTTGTGALGPLTKAKLKILYP